jgi:isopentenyl-diphosphate delta-isomerase
MKPLRRFIEVEGKVVSGEKVGRKIGFPTANLELSKGISIKPGVYVAIVYLENKTYFGLAYYGKRYIFGEKKLSFEVYLVNFQESIYGQNLKLKLTHFIRGPKKLKNLRELKKALTIDLQTMGEGQAILVNNKDQIVGLEGVRLVHQNPPKLHRASSVFLFNQKKEMLIQKRSRYKPLWPLYWSNTSCTNTKPGETPLQAASRSLKNEMGLNLKLNFSHWFIYKAYFSRELWEYELDSVFTGIITTNPKPNYQEVAEFRWVTISDLKKEIEKTPQIFTPWFKLTLKKPGVSDILKT